MSRFAQTTFASLVIAASVTACGPDVAPTAGNADQLLVEKWLAEPDFAAPALTPRPDGSYDYEVPLAKGKLVVNLAAYDGSALTAPAVFHALEMTKFVGRDPKLQLVEIDPSHAAEWITSSEYPPLCGANKLDSNATVTLADGTEHEVGVGIAFVADMAKYIDVSNGGCPNPALGQASCTSKACKLDFTIGGIGVVLNGDCQYSSLGSWFRACLCNVIVPDEKTTTL